jgi:signal transduction histidine kinase
MEKSPAGSAQTRMSRIRRTRKPSGSVCARAFQSFGSGAERRLQLRSGARVRTVKADRDRLLQAIGNLLNNALKFTPDGGRMSLRAAAHDGSAEIWHRISSEPNEDL